MSKIKWIVILVIAGGILYFGYSFVKNIFTGKPSSAGISTQSGLGFWTEVWNRSDTIEIKVHGNPDVARFTPSSKYQIEAGKTLVITYEGAFFLKPLVGKGSIVGPTDGIRFRCGGKTYTLQKGITEFTPTKSDREVEFFIDLSAMPGTKGASGQVSGKKFKKGTVNLTLHQLEPGHGTPANEVPSVVNVDMEGIPGKAIEGLRRVMPDPPDPDETKAFLDGVESQVEKARNESPVDEFTDSIIDRIRKKTGETAEKLTE